MVVFCITQLLNGNLGVLYASDSIIYKENIEDGILEFCLTIWD